LIFMMPYESTAAKSLFTSILFAQSQSAKPF